MTTELVALGLAAVAAALLARIGRRAALPTIPAFMLAGILVGPEALGLIDRPHELDLVADIGLIVLLFHLGVEFPLERVLASSTRILQGATAYIGLNFGAGLALGFALGWGTAEALVIAGAIGISSSAIVTKLLVELRRLTNAETPVVLGIVVIEDLFLALYLAVLAPFLGDASGFGEAAADFAIAFGFVLGLMLLARYGTRVVSALLDVDDDELLAITVIGLAVLTAGVAQELGVSDAVGALMIGLVVSQTVVRERAERIVTPIRDAFAAIFFVVFGATIAFEAAGSVIVPVLIAALLTLAMNSAGGIFVARLNGLNQRAAANTGLVLLGRGEFSLILATLAIGAGLDSRIAPFIALYVLLLALIGPVLATRSERLSRLVPARLFDGYDFVGHETIAEDCPHVDVLPAAPISDGCEDCRALGDEWTHLRTCLTCGYVGCCDDSKNRHATVHFHASGHPAIASLEPNEHWRYCYVDEILVAELGDEDQPAGAAPL